MESLNQSNLQKLVVKKIIPQISTNSVQSLISVLPKKDAAICQAVLGVSGKFGFNPDAIIQGITSKVTSLSNEQWLSIEDIILDVIDGKEVSIDQLVSIFKRECK